MITWVLHGQAIGSAGVYSLAALAAFAWLGLGWVPTMWLLGVFRHGAAGLGIVLPPESRTGTAAHIAAAVVVGLAAIGVGLGW